MVLIRHTKRKVSRKNESIKRQTIVHLMISISGIMFLFGMTWFFAVLTFSAPGLRETGSTLFTVFTSLQGFFVFVFFCLASKEARESWRELFSCGKYKSRFLHPSLLKYNISSGMTGTMKSTLTRIPASLTSPNNDTSMSFKNKSFDDKSQNLQAIIESSVDAEVAYVHTSNSDQERFSTGEDKGNMDNTGSFVTNKKNKGVHQKMEPLNIRVKRSMSMKQGKHDVEVMEVDFYSSSSSDDDDSNAN